MRRLPITNSYSIVFVARTLYLSAPRDGQSPNLLCRGSSGRCEQVLERVWPNRGIIHLHIANAAHARLDELDVGFDYVFGHPDLHAERKLFSLTARLNLFGRELRFRGHEADITSNRTARSIIYGNPRLR